MRFSIADAARAMLAMVQRIPRSAGDVSSFSIDSRTLQPGDLFFAIQGEVHDGHKFVADVLARARRRRWCRKIRSGRAGDPR